MKSDKQIDYNIITLNKDFKNIDIPQDKFIELDMGCGKGSFTSKLAKKYPDHQLIAADVMLGRLRKLAKRNKKLNIDNIKLVRAEAWHLLCRALPDKSIDRIHILCPDPWPKARHKGYRLISSEFIGRLSQKLKENGIFHFSTDDIEYYNHTVQTVYKTKLFELNSNVIKDILDIKSDFELHWEEMNLKVNHISWILKA